MRNKLFAIVIAMLVLVDLNAQDNFDRDSVYYTPIPKETPSRKKETSKGEQDGERISYFFTIGSGALVGCQDCKSGSEVTFSSATIHGVTIGKKLRVGAGLGYDSYYLLQTTPIFGSVSLDLIGNRNKNALFLQFSYGGAGVWRNSQDEYGYKKVEGGKVINTQLGYRVRYHDMRFSFSIGTKYQEVTTFYEYPTFIYNFNGQYIAGTPSTKSVLQEMNRLQFSLAIGWR